MKIAKWTSLAAACVVGFAFSVLDPLAAEQTSPAGSQSKPFILAVLKSADGALGTQLQAHIKKAHDAGLKPYVEFDDDWCTPCIAIRDNLNEARMADAFRGTYIIRMSAMEWLEKLDKTGFDASTIPIFYEIDDQGKPTKRTISGGAWKEDVPANMAPLLKKFFHPAAASASKPQAESSTATAATGGFDAAQVAARVQQMLNNNTAFLRTHSGLRDDLTALENAVKALSADNKSDADKTIHLRDAVDAAVQAAIERTNDIAGRANQSAADKQKVQQLGNVLQGLKGK